MYITLRRKARIVKHYQIILSLLDGSLISHLKLLKKRIFYFVT